MLELPRLSKTRRPSHPVSDGRGGRIPIRLPTSDVLWFYFAFSNA
jgi:hypothetical protein